MGGEEWPGSWQPSFRRRREDGRLIRRGIRFWWRIISKSCLDTEIRSNLFMCVNHHYIEVQACIKYQETRRTYNDSYNRGSKAISLVRVKGP
jgi:hypothetical protein